MCFSSVQKKITDFSFHLLELLNYQQQKGKTDNIERVDKLNNKSRKCASPKKISPRPFFSPLISILFFFKIILKFKRFLRGSKEEAKPESKKITKKKIGASVATFLVLFFALLYLQHQTIDHL